MTAKILWALLRKDFRVYRAPILGLLIVGVGLLANGMIQAGIVGDNATFASMTYWQRFVQKELDGVGILGLLTLVLLAATFGGMAFAAERRDGQADFLSLLPPTRMGQAVSKLLVAGVLLAASFGSYVWLLRTGVLANHDHGALTHLDGGTSRLVIVLGNAAFLSFGVAWLTSSVLRSSAISACIGGATPLLACVVMSTFDLTHRVIDQPALWVAVSIGLGLMGIFGGLTIQARRVRP